MSYAQKLILPTFMGSREAFLRHMHLKLFVGWLWVTMLYNLDPKPFILERRVKYLLAPGIYIELIHLFMKSCILP